MPTQQGSLSVQHAGAASDTQPRQGISCHNRYPVDTLGRTNMAKAYCSVRVALLQSYTKCAQRHANAVEQMSAARGARFDALLKEAKSARVECEKTGLALAKHCKEHGC
jgi:hypothetical protein